MSSALPVIEHLPRVINDSQFLLCSYAYHLVLSMTSRSRICDELIMNLRLLNGFPRQPHCFI